MPSNDTENIYATQYGGEGEPIPATKISYDNTTSGLTSDDVQEAIDEVALEAKDLTTALTGKIVKKQVALNKLSVKADGVKTWGALLNELGAAFKTVLEGLADNEVIAPKVLFYQGIAWCGIIGTDYFTNATTTFGMAFSRIDYYSSKIRDVVGRLSSTENDGVFVIGEYDGNGATITNKLSDVPAENTLLEIQYDAYVKL